MDYQDLSSVNGSVISVTTTATPLFSLINTAAGSNTTFVEGLNGVDLHVEAGSIRISFGANAPTASKGVLLDAGIYCLRNVNLAALQLISATGSNVPVSLEVGTCNIHEVGFAVVENDVSVGNVTGNVAAAATDSGNPVKVGGVFHTSQPTYTDGQRGDAQLTKKGAFWVALQDSNGNGIAEVTAGDASGNNTTTIGVTGFNELWNGASWDRQRGNTDVSLLASAARTTTQTSADQVNYNDRGINIVVDVTSAGTGSITMTVNYKDPASGKYITILSGAAITTTSTNLYQVYPGLTAAANAVANNILPRTFQIVITANNANSVTYSVGYSLIK